MNAPEKLPAAANAPAGSGINDSSAAATMPPEVAQYYTRLPQPPRFNTHAEERLHRKQRLAAAFRIFAQWGLGEGAAGHITVRDPEFPDTFWLNPFGIHFSQIKVSNLIRCDHEGKVVEGDRLTIIHNGIVEADLKRLFEDDVQGSDHGDEIRGGFGLGLASSRRMAQLLQGDVGLESKWKNGSAFWLDMPPG